MTSWAWTLLAEHSSSTGAAATNTTDDEWVEYPVQMLVDQSVFGAIQLVLFAMSTAQLCFHKGPRRVQGTALMGGHEQQQRAPRIRLMFQRASLVLAVLMLYRFGDFIRFNSSTTTETADIAFIGQETVKRFCDSTIVYCVTVFSYETTLNTFLSINLVKGTRDIPAMLLPSHMCLFITTVVVEIACAFAGPLLNKSWPASFLFMWLAFVTLALCIMTLTTGFVLRKMMKSMGPMGPQDSGVRDPRGGRAPPFMPVSDGWGPNPTAGVGGAGAGGTASGSHTPGVGRSESNLSQSNSTHFASQSELSRPRKVRKDASSLLLRRLTRFFIIIAIATPCIIGYQIYWVARKSDMMNEPMLGDESHVYRFMPLQWVHLVSAIVFSWFAWRPLSRSSAEDDFGPEEDDEDDQIDRLSDVY